MRFYEERLGKYVRHVLFNEKTGEHVAIMPEFGAMLNALTIHSKNGELVNLIDGYNTSQKIVEEVGKSFKGTKLSPFANRINQGKYWYKGNSYQLDINLKEEGHALHGLLYNSPFTLDFHEADQDVVSAAYSYVYACEKEGFPFKYELLVTFRFTSENQFTCTTKIKNMSDTVMPLGDGWHPVFKTDVSVDKMHVKFTAENQVNLNGIMPGQKAIEFDKFKDYKAIGEEAFDHCFKLKSSGNSVFSLLYQVLGLKINIWQETGEHKYNYMHIYTPDDRRSIAIEPVTCAPDAFNNGEGLKELQPDEEISLSYGIEVEHLSEDLR